MMLPMSNRMRVWVALLALLILGTWGSLSARNNEADAAVELEPGVWLIFSLPPELKASGGFHETFYDSQKNLVLTVTPLQEHPAQFVSRMASLSQSSGVKSESGAEEPYKKYLLDSLAAVAKWSKALSYHPDYKLEGGVRPSPLSEQTRATLEKLQARWKKSSEGDTTIDVKELMKSSSTTLLKLEGSLADQYLLQLILAQKHGHKYPFGKLSSRKEKVGRHKVLVVRNELPQFTEEIVFLDIYTRGYAFAFRQPVGQESNFQSMITTAVGSAQQTGRRPDFGLGSAPRKDVPAGLVAVKQVTIFLVALAMVGAADKRAAQAWEICRCRESLSSRETYRIFKSAFWTLCFLGGFTLYWNYILPVESDLLALRNLSKPDAVPALGVLLLASMLPTLGARLGCRFSKRGCRILSAAGCVLGLLLISATVVGLLGG